MRNPIKNVSYTDRALAQSRALEKESPTSFRKLNRLIEDILRDPYKGLGKPEPLRHELSGYWARRITEEHRLVYYVDDNTLFIIQCRFHYDKK